MLRGRGWGMPKVPAARRRGAGCRLAAELLAQPRGCILPGAGPQPAPLASGHPPGRLLSSTGYKSAWEINARLAARWGRLTTRPCFGGNSFNMSFPRSASVRTAPASPGHGQARPSPQPQRGRSAASRHAGLGPAARSWPPRAALEPSCLSPVLQPLPRPPRLKPPRDGEVLLKRTCRACPDTSAVP